MSKEPFEIDFEVIREPLEKVLVAAVNKLEREWPSSATGYGPASVNLRSMVLVSDNLFRTMRFFCAETPVDPSRKVEYSKAAPLLARAILEMIFTTAFMLEDLPARTKWFEKAGWRSMWEDFERLQKTYGGDPDWSGYLLRVAAHLETGRTLFGITADEVADPIGRIQRWPNRSRMRRKASPELAAHLEYLGDWFYKTLSEDAHLSWFGLVRHAAGLLDVGDSEQIDLGLRKQRSEAIATIIILLLTLLSEIEVTLRLGLGERLMFLWRIMNEGFPSGKELYVRRFEGRLY